MAIRARPDKRDIRRKKVYPQGVRSLDTQPHTQQQVRSLLENVVAWVLTRPVLDRILTNLACRPRLVMVFSLLCGLGLILSSLLPLLNRGVTLPTKVQEQAGVADTSLMERNIAPASVTQIEDELVGLIAAYNQASITAGLVGEPNGMAPFLIADGAVWKQIQTEYTRRAQRGELHDARLIRWGILQSSWTADTAVIETQEEWDVITSVGGTVLSSQRGILTRNTYRLQRSTDLAWRIVSIDTTQFLG